MAAALLAGPIRLLVSDVDGTLVRHDKSLSEANRAAARRLAAAGVPMTLISSRPPSGILWLAEALAIDRPLGAFNGGTLFRSDGSIIRAHHLERDAALAALRLIRRPGVTPWVFARGQWFAETAENRYIPRERLSTSLEPILRSDFSDLLAEIDKIVGVSEDHALLMAVEAEVKAGVGPAATIVRSQPYYLDVTHPLANKGTGVTALAEAIGVPLAETAVIGDMANDLAMFAKAGVSIAMGQAPEEVKRAASLVTASNDEDGVAAAIERFVIPSAAGH